MRMCCVLQAFHRRRSTLSDARFENTVFCSTSEETDDMATVSYQATLLECCVLQHFRRMQIALAGGAQKRNQFWGREGGNP